MPHHQKLAFTTAVKQTLKPAIIPPLRSIKRAMAMVVRANHTSTGVIYSSSPKTHRQTPTAPVFVRPLFASAWHAATARFLTQHGTRHASRVKGKKSMYVHTRTQMTRVILRRAVWFAPEALTYVRAGKVRRGGLR